MTTDAKIDLSLNGTQSVVGGLKLVGDKIGDVSSSIAALTAMGGGLSLAAFATMIKGSIDAADHLNDLKKTTGLAIGELSGLQLLAKQSGSDLDSLAATVSKLSVNMGKDAEKFAKIGVTAKDPIEAYKQLSDVFVGIDDPQKRAAFGAEALGKKWEGAAPALAEGGARIGEIIEKGRRLSGITDEMAENADKLNDQWAELGMLAGQFSNKMASDMLPGLIDVTGAVKLAYEESGKLQAAWVALGSIGAFLFTDEFSSASVKIKNLKAELDTLEAYQHNTKAAPVISWILWGSEAAWDADIAEKRAQIKALQDEIQQGLNPTPAAPGAPKKTPKGIDGFIGGGDKISDYEKLTRSIKEKTSAEQQQLQLGRELTNSEKIHAKMIADITAGTIKLLPQQRAKVEALLGEYSAIEQLILAEKFYSDQAKKRLDDTNAQIKAATDEAIKNEELAHTFGMTAQAIELQEVARLKEQLAQRISIGQCTEETAKLEGLIEARQRNADAIGSLDAQKSAADALKDFDAAMDPAKAQDFGTALTESFNAAGDAVLRMTKASSDYNRTLAQNQKLQDELNKNKALGVNVDSRQAALNKKAARDQIGHYGTMADAAKGFFSEGSKGYKTLDGVARAYHTAQMAMQLVEMTQGAIAAVINQGKGDPYTAWVRMAGMAAAMAAIGFSVGGGFQSSSGGVSSADRQRTQGTGTVLGDASAKSESLMNAMEDLRDNSDLTMPISQEMLASLQNIEAAMTGLAQILFRTAGITSGNGLGVFEGTLALGQPGAMRSVDNVLMKWEQEVTPIVGDMAAGLIGAISSGLWGKTTQNITDSGLTIKGTLGDVSQGRGVSQYANVRTEKRSVFGLVKSGSDSTVYGEVDATVSDQIGKVFDGIADALLAASSTFTDDAAAVQQKLQDYIVDIPTISLRGLKGEALQEALNAVFSSFSDTLATTILPGMQDFQQVGEGYFQTLVRIVNGVESSASALEKFGITAVKFEDIINKQGDVGVEIMRQSIQAVELGVDGMLTGVGKMIDAFDGSVSDLTNMYRDLMDRRRVMDNAGLDGSKLSAYTFAGAGGSSEFGSALNAYFEKYFTADEKAAAQVKNVAAQFERLGVQMPTTMAGFRALIESAGDTTDAEQKRLGELIALSEPFADALNDATNGLNDLVSSLTGFRESLDGSTYSGLSSLDQTASARAQLNKTYTMALAGDQGAAASIQGKVEALLSASKITSSKLEYQRDLAGAKLIIDNVINAAKLQSSLMMTMRETSDERMGFDDGASIGGIDLASNASKFLKLDGSHKSGLGYVPFDGYLAQLHRGESVLTNKEAENYRNSDAVVKELQDLKKELQDIRDASAKTAEILVRLTPNGTALVTEAEEA